MEIFEQNSIVAFIDILGFKDIVLANSQSKDNVIFKELINAIEQSYKKAFSFGIDGLSAIGDHFEENLTSKFKYKVFSDNLFISYDYEEDLSDYGFAVYWITAMSVIYQREMLNKKFYVRGGIADGQNYSNDHVIFSDALIKAYELETKIAKYPRIVVEDSIVRKQDECFNEHIFKSELKKVFVKDWTGTLFVNPFKLFESFGELIPKVPEAMPIINKMREDTKVLKLEPDVTDYILAQTVTNDLNIKLKQYGKVPELYEKYLWLYEFINWNDEHPNNLIFEYLYK